MSQVFTQMFTMLKWLFTTTKLLIFLYLSFVIGGIALFFMGGTDDCHLKSTAQLVENHITIVQAQNEAWTSSGISVDKDENIQIKARGEVKLCKGTTRAGVAGNVPIEYESTQHKWIPTGVFVRQGAPLTLEVLGQYSQFPDANCENDLNPSYAYYKDPNINDSNANDRVFSLVGIDNLAPEDRPVRIANTGRWIDKKSTELACFSTLGKGLFVHIGEPNGGLEASQFDNPKYEGRDDRFFELFDYIKSTDSNAPKFNSNNGTTSLYNAPASGQVYLRYGESTTPVGQENSQWQWQTEASASDNRQNYSVKIISNCSAENGGAMIAYIGNQAPSAASNTGSFINLDAAYKFTSATDKVFIGKAPSKGTIFYKIVDITETNNTQATGDGYYYNNSGEYQVGLNYGTKDTDFTFLNKLIEPVKILLHGYTDDNDKFHPGIPETFFKAITLNGKFLVAIQACLVLMIVLYGFNFVAAGKGGSLEELITLVVRMGIIFALISEESWEFFYDYLFRGLMGAIDEISAMFIAAVNPNALGNTSGGLVGVQGEIYDLGDKISVGKNDNITNLFSFLSVIINFLTEGSNWLRLLSFFTHSITSILIVFAVAMSIVYFFLTVFRVLLTYLTSMIFLGLLIGMGPIFLGFILFDYTRKFAHKWLRAILFYALNPVMLLALMSIFSVMYYSLLHQMFNFDICYECIIDFGIPIFGGKFCILANFTPWVVSGDVLARSYVDAVAAISLLIIASAMNKLPDLSYKFAIRISGADSISDSGSGGGSMGGQMGETAKNSASDIKSAATSSSRTKKSIANRKELLAKKEAQKSKKKKET